MMNMTIPLGSTSLSIRTVLKAFQFGVEVVKGWNVVFTMIPQGWRWDLRYILQGFVKRLDAHSHIMDNILALDWDILLIILPDWG